MRLLAATIAGVLGASTVFDLAFAGSRAAQAAPALLPHLNDQAGKFGARPNVSAVALSPDGRELAYLTPLSGDRSAVVIFDIESGKARAITDDRGNTFSLRLCRWKTNTRLLCTLNASSAGRGTRTLLGFSRTIAIDADGTRPKEIGERYGQSTGWVIDMLPDDPAHVLMAMPTSRGLYSERVDVLTNARTDVPPIQHNIVMLDSDGHGHVRAMGI